MFFFMETFTDCPTKALSLLMFERTGFLLSNVAAISWAVLTADDDAIVWVNGKEVKRPVNNRVWNKAQNYTFPEQVEVLAVEITNGEGPTGLLASFSDGSVTSARSGWKCIVGSPPVHWNQVGFDDSNWPVAAEFDGNFVRVANPNARWIRADKVSDYIKTFCRHHYKTGLKIFGRDN